MGQANLQGGAEQEELVLPAQGKRGKGSDQAGDGLGPGASVGLNKRVRAEGRAGSHKPLWAMGNTQGGGNGQAGGCRLGVRGALGEGGREANRGGRSDQEPEGLNGCFRGALQVHIVRVRHHADVRKRLPHPFEEESTCINLYRCRYPAGGPFLPSLDVLIFTSRRPEVAEPEVASLRPHSRLDSWDACVRPITYCINYLFNLSCRINPAGSCFPASRAARRATLPVSLGAETLLSPPIPPSLLSIPTHFFVCKPFLGAWFPRATFRSRHRILHTTCVMP
jgi:hypothetical protein